MRCVQNAQMALGQIPIADIQFDASSRDDIPAVLRGLQHLYCDDELRQQVFDLLEQQLLQRSGTDADADAAPAARINPDVGRPGLQLWQVVVLAVLKQGLNCDYDRLAELASKHLDVRRMLGLPEGFAEQRFTQRTVARNVGLLGPQLLAGINQLAVQAGLRVAGQAGGEPRQARVDSFVVETRVHYPTDVSLLWDAMRCLLRVLLRVCEQSGVGGWRQARHWTQRVRRLFQRVRTARQRRGRPGQQRVRLYLRVTRRLAQRARTTVAELATAGVEEAEQEEIERYLGYAELLIDQIERRVLQGETIPQQEKVFSLFEPHTRWCVKGKAGVPVELGVPVSVVECAQQFVLHWQVMWEEQDVDVAAELVERTQRLYPSLEECSFDKGYHSPANREALDRLLQQNVLPRKGRLTKADREREGAPAFVAARRAHAAVESAISNLEQRGLGRVLARGAAGFERMVALSMVALNLHRIGLLLQRAERARRKRKRERQRRALQLRRAA